MLRAFSIWTTGLFLPIFFAVANGNPLTPKAIDLRSVEKGKPPRKAPPTAKIASAPFTGKVVGDKVRVRLAPDLDSHIVSELDKSSYVSVISQEGDFYSIEPSSAMKAYIFRSFVLDGIVEGNRVNVRLEPDLEAPVIGHVSSGDRVDGTVSSASRKWLEISPPPNTRFYVSKEFVEYVGGPELKEKMVKREETVSQLLEAANLYATSEMKQPFEEIEFERIKEGFLAIIHEYTDFPEKAALAKQALTQVQEEYLEKRIAYLEEKAALTTVPRRSRKTASPSGLQTRMWAPIEEGLFQAWSSAHGNKPIEAFYEEQLLLATSVTGVLEAFNSPVNNKPGDYIIKQKNIPVAYLYSTKVDLEDYIGREVTVIGSPRPNNHFAFPAYFVHTVDEE